MGLNIQLCLLLAGLLTLVFGQMNEYCVIQSDDVEGLSGLSQESKRLISKESCDDYLLSSSKEKILAEGYHGNVLIVDNTTSTMDLAAKYADIPNLLVIANIQTAPRTRSNSSYNSPFGDIYMTLNVDPANISQVNIVEPIAAISMLQAIKGLYNNADNLDVKVRWPRSIYWGDQKIGGVLVEILPNSSVTSVGIGIRHSSEELGLKHLLKDHNNRSIGKTSQLDLLPKEKIIVAVANKLQENIALTLNDEEYAHELIKNKANLGKFRFIYDLVLESIDRTVFD